MRVRCRLAQSRLVEEVSCKASLLPMHHWRKAKKMAAAELVRGRTRCHAAIRDCSVAHCCLPRCPHSADVVARPMVEDC